MSQVKLGANNPLHGKEHTQCVKTKALMSRAKLGKTHTEETKALISAKNGTLVDSWNQSSMNELSFVTSFGPLMRVYPLNILMLVIVQ